MDIATATCYLAPTNRESYRRRLRNREHILRIKHAKYSLRWLFSKIKAYFHVKHAKYSWRCLFSKIKCLDKFSE
jgi:hypothetical protein